MKYLFLFSLFAFVALLLYWRLRPYIHAVRRTMNALRQMQGGTINHPAARKTEARAVTEGQLVRCARCGTWVPEARALRLPGKGGAAYCSRACLETENVEAASRSATGESR